MFQVDISAIVITSFGGPEGQFDFDVFDSASDYVKLMKYAIIALVFVEHFFYSTFYISFGEDEYSRGLQFAVCHSFLFPPTVLCKGHNRNILVSGSLPMWLPCH